MSDEQVRFKSVTTPATTRCLYIARYTVVDHLPG